MSSAHDPKTSHESGPSLWTALRVFLSFTSPRSFLVMIPLLVTLLIQAFSALALMAVLSGMAWRGPSAVQNTTRPSGARSMPRPS